MTLKFNFKRVSPNPGSVPHPYIPVNIINPQTNLSFDTYALMDCGASRNLFPESVANFIGINEIGDTEGTPEGFGDVGGHKVIGYPHKVIIELGGSYRFETVVYFSKDVHEDALLLGVRGFFDRFIVKLDACHERIELTPLQV